MKVKYEYRDGKCYASVWEGEKKLWADPHGWDDSSESSAEAYDQIRRIQERREAAEVKLAERSFVSAML